MSVKNKLQEKLKDNKFFINNFGFESGIDIANDTQVLYRKNYVIKNIVFISNLIYAIVFSLLLHPVKLITNNKIITKLNKVFFIFIFSLCLIFLK